MARKEKTIVIEKEGRDKGKMFIIHEMPPSKAEKWAIRAILALAKSGVEVPDDIANAGMAGIAMLGLKAFGGLRYEDAEPLLDEMFAMVAVIPDPQNPAIKRGCGGVGPLIEDDIEEVMTRLTLRKELFTLHTGFSFPVAR
ncbi:hypothetical protein [Robbsia sp. KACC 23696]|uniref:hypothetical protein n=1 Tax=Robbsia sp. KACC 23696 TaxID=3149231 RepID=UPI00325AEB9E